MFQNALKIILQNLKWEKFSEEQIIVLRVLLVEKKPMVLGAATNWGKSVLYKVLLSCNVEHTYSVGNLIEIKSHTNL